MKKIVSIWEKMTSGGWLQYGLMAAFFWGVYVVILKYTIDPTMSLPPVPPTSSGSIIKSNFIWMFGLDTKKNITKGTSRGRHNSYGTLGNRRR